MEQFLETVLWRFRLIMLFTVIVALFVIVLVIFTTFIDLAHLASLFWTYLTSSHDISTRQAMMLVVELLDGFLMAGVLLIFSFGLYELFINWIEPAQQCLVEEQTGERSAASGLFGLCTTGWFRKYQWVKHPLMISILLCCASIQLIPQNLNRYQSRF